jgi:hypothetical protein
MGTLKETQTQAVLDRAASTEAGTYEWWTALSFEDGDLALEPTPVATADDDVDELELRLYSL